MLSDEKNQSTYLVPTKAVISYPTHWQPFCEKWRFKLEFDMNRDEMIIRILDRTEPWDTLSFSQCTRGDAGGS